MNKEQEIKIANLNQFPAVIRIDETYGDYSVVFENIPKEYGNDISIENIPFTDESTNHFEETEVALGVVNDNHYIEICGEHDLKTAASLGFKTELIGAIYPEVLDPNFTFENKVEPLTPEL